MMKLFSFRYTDAMKSPYLYLIRNIGTQVVRDPAYTWDGNKRESSGMLFQYTLAGEGRLEIGGRTYNVPKNHGFFVTLPSDHRYFYDASSKDPWDFIWIKLHPTPHLAEIWSYVTSRIGHVVYIPRESEFVHLHRELYNDVASQKLTSKYQVSIRVNEWITALIRMVEGDANDIGYIPDSLQESVHFIERNFAKPITLEQLAEAAGLSRNYFCRKFTEHTGLSAMHYLRKVRIEMALKLMQQHELTITEIAQRTGFDNISYFGKVFRQLIGKSPSEYRESLPFEDQDNIRFIMR